MWLDLNLWGLNTFNQVAKPQSERQDQIHQCLLPEKADELAEGGSDEFEPRHEQERVAYKNTYEEHREYLDFLNSQKRGGGFNGKFWLDGKLTVYARYATCWKLSNRSRVRFLCVWIVTRPIFETMIIGVILGNAVLLGMKDYADEEDVTPVNRVIHAYEPYLTALIYLEFALKVTAMGFAQGQGAYLKDAWNYLDCIVVASTFANSVSGAASPGGGQGKGLSALRSIRLLRPLKLLSKIPALKVLVTTLFGSVMGLSGILGLALFFFSIFSILGMTVWAGRIHYRCYQTPEPEGGEWEVLKSYTALCSDAYPCPAGSYCGSRFEARNGDGTPYAFNNPDLWADTYIEELHWGLNNFDNIGFAFYTIFQVTTLDGWTVIMNIHERAFNKYFSFAYFMSAVVVCSFFILNLTVAQMIMKYEQYSQEEHTHDAFERQLQEQAKDTFEEEHQALVDFIIETEAIDLAPEAKRLLTNRSSFVKVLFQKEKLPVTERQRKESRYYRNSVVKACLAVAQDAYFNAFILLVIILNTICLAMDKYPDYPAEILTYFSYLNIAFTVVFTVEVAVKLVALGARPFCSDGVNIFDLLIVVASVSQIVLESTGREQKGALVMIFRTLRVFRIFKLFKIGGLRMLLDSIAYTLPQMGPYVVLLSFFMYIFALVGMNFYAGQIKFDADGKVDLENGTTVRENYDTLGWALLTIFQVLMGAEWRFIAYQHMLATGVVGAGLFYVAIHAIIGIVMLNLFLAIMLGNFEKARCFNQKKQLLEAFHELYREREDKYSFGEVCDLCFGDMSPHLRYNVLREARPAAEAAQKKSLGARKTDRLAKSKQRDSNGGRSISPRSLSDYKLRKTGVIDPVRSDDLLGGEAPNEGRGSGGQAPERLRRSASGASEVSQVAMEASDTKEAGGAVKDGQPQESFYAMASLWVFHIDWPLRRFCLKLSVPKADYEAAIKSRTRTSQEEDEGAPAVDFNIGPKKKETDLYTAFDNCILVMICFSSVILPLENPVADPTSDLVLFAKLANLVLTGFFLAELLIKIVARGLLYNQLRSPANQRLGVTEGEEWEITPYLKEGWNQIDALVVAISLVDAGYALSGAKSQFAALKALRALRALRPLRVIRRFDQLRVVVNALLATIAAVQNVILVGFLLLLIFGVLGVTLLKGSFGSCSSSAPEILTKEDCLAAGGSWSVNDSNFDNIIQAMRTLFILCTTEGWAGVMFLGVDAQGPDQVPKQDAQPAMALYFVAAMITGALFIMNMFVGVVIANFNQQKEREELGSTFVSPAQREWILLQQIGQQQTLRKKELEPVNFRKHFFRLVNLPAFDNAIIVVVVANTICLGLKYYQMSCALKEALKYANYVFAAVFNFEMAVKLIALDQQYFNSSWNKFDMAIVLTADVGIVLDVLNMEKNFQSAVTILRAIRIMRILRILRKFQSVRVIMDSVIKILPTISNVLSLLLLVIYIYACFGIYLFAGAKRRAELDTYNNFSSFGRAMLGLVRWSTGEDFQEFMYELANEQDCETDQSYESMQENGYRGCGSWLAIPFFMSFQVIAGWLILNLTIAAVIDGLAEAQADDDRLFRTTDIERFLEVWQEYDHYATGSIRIWDFYFLLAELEKPFGTGTRLSLEESEVPRAELERLKQRAEQDEPVRAPSDYMMHKQRGVVVKKLALLKELRGYRTGVDENGDRVEERRDEVQFNINVSLNSEDEVLIEFGEAYKALVIRAFKQYDGDKGEGHYKEYELTDEKYNKKLARGWAKRKSNDSNQTVVGKEDKNYLAQVLAANIIQSKFLGGDVPGFVRRRSGRADAAGGTPDQQYEGVARGVSGVNGRMPAPNPSQRQAKLRPSQAVVAEPKIAPQNVIKSLDEEHKDYKHERPLEVYLSYCNRFASHNLRKEGLSVEHYPFSPEDLRQQVLERNMLEAMTGRRGWRDPVDLSGLLKVESIQVAMEAVYLGRKLVLVVKSWQKVAFTAKTRAKPIPGARTGGPLPPEAPTTKPAGQLGRSRSALSNVASSGRAPKEEALSASGAPNAEPSDDKDCFYVKVLQFHDRHGQRIPLRTREGQPQPIHSQILVEQVNGKFDDVAFFDTSIACWGSKIYYFKRKFSEDAAVDRKEGGPRATGLGLSSTPPGGPPQESFSPLTGDADSENARGPYRPGPSRLQLFSFDVTTGIEEEVGGTCFKESSHPTQNEEASAQEPLQSNAKFSKRFSRLPVPEARTEAEFLGEQYIIMQDYDQSEKRPLLEKDGGRTATQLERQLDFRMMRLSSLQSEEQQNPFFYDTAQSLVQERGLLGQVVAMNHIEDPPGEKDMAFFILTNVEAQVELKYHRPSGEVRHVKVFKRDNLPLREQNSCQEGDLQVQGIDLNTYWGEGDEKTTVQQYFFVDTRNRINIVFPNYEVAAQRQRILRLLVDEARIRQLPYTTHKRITCRAHGCHPYRYLDVMEGNLGGVVAVHEHNVVQRISDLTRLLDYDAIYKDHQLTFCRAHDDEQILYISEQKSRHIVAVSMRPREPREPSSSGPHEEDLSSTVKEKEAQPEASTANAPVENLRLSKFHRKKRRMLARVEPALEIAEEAPPSCPGASSPGLRAPLQLSEQDELEDYHHQLGRRDRQFRRTQIRDEEASNHVLIDDFKGNKVKVKTHHEIGAGSPRPPHSPPRYAQRVVLILQQPSSLYACFVFAVHTRSTTARAGLSATGSAKTEKSYIFVRKTNHEMVQLFEKEDQPLIEDDDEVLLLASSSVQLSIPFRMLGPYQLGDLKEDQMSAEQYEQYCAKAPTVKLTFEKAADRTKRNINFVPFVYQESQNVERNSFRSYDIFQNKLTSPISLSPAQKSHEYVYTDDYGFNSFSLCRTSDVFEETVALKSLNTLGAVNTKVKEQMARYAIFYLYTEKLGRIHGEEFLVTQSSRGYQAQTIGQKQIVFSRAIIESCEWSSLKNTEAVSFFDKTTQQVEGCLLILKTAPGKTSEIRLLDSQYIYQSDILLVGHRKFQLEPEDPSQFLVASACRLRSSYIEQAVFSRDEAYYVLQSCLKTAMSMRIADLAYLVLTTYDELREACFFQSQEALLGRSLCDISLNDNQAIQQALEEREADDYLCLGSIIHALTCEDRARMETFKEQDFFPKTLVIGQDFNCVGSIERAVKYGAYKPLKLLLDHVFHVVNTSDYNNLIMQDLPCIISSNQVKANEFFRMAPSRAIGSENQAQCNIELPFKDAELPLFSDAEHKYITCDGLSSSHNQEIELAQKIIQREAAVGKAERKGHIVEHAYMDFSKLIVGDKIRAIAQGQSYDEVRFDDIYLSQLLLRSGQHNPTLYQCESIQKVVDYQWVEASKMLRIFFFVYVLFYSLPISASLFTADEQAHRRLLYVAAAPAVVLFSIEVIQMRQAGVGYLGGWNSCDFMQFFVFMIILLLNHLGADHRSLFIPQLKGFLVILALIKLLFFLRVFEAYGILIQIIGVCIVELVPFITCYLVFLLMFSLGFAVLRMEVDAESDQLEGLGYFEKIVIETFRTAVGEVGFPGYSAIMAEEPSMWRGTNVISIWALWFVQAFFMLVVLLNFLVAVLQQTYDRIQSYQKIILYRQRAELNEECFTLMQIFQTLPRYKYVVFSSSSRAQTEDNYYLAEIRNQMKAMAQSQGRRILTCHEELSRKLRACAESQQLLRNSLNRACDRLSHSYEEAQVELVGQVGKKRAEHKAG